MQPTPVFLPGKSYGQRSLVAAVHGVPQGSGTVQGTESEATGESKKLSLSPLLPSERNEHAAGALDGGKP